jgi:hypothetical protein
MALTGGGIGAPNRGYEDDDVSRELDARLELAGFRAYMEADDIGTAGLSLLILSRCFL